MPVNPFEAIARSATESPAYAKTLAECFAVAHEPSDVHASIRFARRRGFLPRGDYLSGCLFADYQVTIRTSRGDTPGMIDLATHLDALRDMAHDFLDAG